MNGAKCHVFTAKSFAPLGLEFVENRMTQGYASAYPGLSHAAPVGAFYKRKIFWQRVYSAITR